MPGDNEKVINIYKITDKLTTKDRIRRDTSSSDSYVLPKSYQELSGAKIKIDTCLIVTNNAVYKIRLK